MRIVPRVIIIVFVVACHEPPPVWEAADAQTDDALQFDPGPEPTSMIDPVFGELTIEQLALPAGFTLKIGESAILVGPDGTIVLLDVGNTNHDDNIRDELKRLNTRVLTPARGFAARAPLQVEWVILTHFHGDHIGGLPDLLQDSEPLQVTQGIIHRGYADVGDAMNPGAYASACALLTGAFGALDRPLCHAATPAPCDQDAWRGNYPAVDCDGLSDGDLANPTPGTPSFIRLGDGARLVLIGADGFVSDGTALHAAPPWGHEQNGQENARSLVGVVEYGAFRYHFAGDLTGAGDTESPDLETHLVTTAAVWYGDRGVDVTHAHHHVRKTSSNAAFVSVVAPSDGYARNVTGGINAAYVGSPADEVLAAFGDGDRLRDGRIWVTHDAVSGGSHTALVDADGPVIVQTIQRGAGYRVQAAGDPFASHAYPSVRSLP